MMHLLTSCQSPGEVHVTPLVVLRTLASAMQEVEELVPFDRNESRVRKNVVVVFGISVWQHKQLKLVAHEDSFAVSSHCVPVEWCAQ
jgi:hypothetical protein